MEETEDPSVYCSICLNTEQNDTRYMNFPCQHVFHVKCFEEYFDYNMQNDPDVNLIQCPICRKTLPTNVLHSVFYVAHENPNRHINIIIRDDNNNNEMAFEQQTNTQAPMHQRCRKADIVVITLLLLGLTLYLLALYKVI